ncbi:hypothetical protein [Paraclostridium bifermentans]|uniref:hypothetical protein n=1 Tax=Paraclostridium bifermentans TaxID=1490 RepID=UPI0022E74B39|nr:hypothetical protein [Paraclostridium bifermentans]MCU9808125.1 hypothetical protein [Paraclostridium sp. AKS46]
MSDQKLVVKDLYGNIIAKSSTKEPMRIYGVTKTKQKEIIEDIFQGTHWEVSNIGSEKVDTPKEIQSISVNAVLEKYEDPILEVNEDNEVVIKIGKFSIGGVK